MRLILAETVVHYHMIEMDDEIPVDEALAQARELVADNHAGYEAMDTVLNRYKQQYGFEYELKPNYCGTDCVHLDYDEVE